MMKVILIVVGALILIGAGVYLLTSQDVDTNSNGVLQNTNASVTNTSLVHDDQEMNAGKNDKLLWQREEGGTWRAAGTPPSCPDPLVLQSPVNLDLASSLLLPGQVRGGEYKPHGGFRFDGQRGDAVEVVAPIDGWIYEGSRYLEQGIEQYLLVFINPCGIMYRFDHIFALSEELEPFGQQLPLNQEGDSRTTLFRNAKKITTGTPIATHVGLGENVSVDFGVYDLRQKNSQAQDLGWAAAHPTDQAQHAVCWLDLLNSQDAAKARNLVTEMSTAEGASAYCS